VRDCLPKQLCEVDGISRLNGRVSRQPALETVLAADAQTLNQSFVAFWTAILQILQQPSAARHHHEQTALRVMILFVPLEMLRQLQNALTQKSYLDLWRTGIRLMYPVLRNYFGFLFNCQSHARNDTPRLYLNLDFICLMVPHRRGVLSTLDARELVPPEVLTLHLFFA
jgi:hypothetical protein